MNTIFVNIEIFIVSGIPPSIASIGSEIHTEFG